MYSKMSTERKCPPKILTKTVSYFFIPEQLSAEQQFSCWILEALQQLEVHLVYSRPSMIYTNQITDQTEAYLTIKK